MPTISHKRFEVVRFHNSLFMLKDQAHKYFDQLWQFNYCTRAEAYQHLANWLGVEEPQAHMRVMKEEQCRKVIEWSIMMLNDMRRLDLDFGAPIRHPYYELTTK